MGHDEAESKFNALIGVIIPNDCSIVFTFIKVAFLDFTLFVLFSAFFFFSGFDDAH